MINKKYLLKSVFVIIATITVVALLFVVLKYNKNNEAFYTDPTEEIVIPYNKSLSMKLYKTNGALTWADSNEFAIKKGGLLPTLDQLKAQFVKDDLILPQATAGDKFFPYTYSSTDTNPQSSPPTSPNYWAAFRGSVYLTSGRTHYEIDNSWPPWGTNIALNRNYSPYLYVVFPTPTSTPYVSTASTVAATVGSTVAASTIPAATCPPVIPPIPASIISRYFGVGYNVNPVPNQKDYYTIQYVPTLTSSTKVLGGVFIMTDDTNALSYETKNDMARRQWWKFTKFTDPKSSNPYYIVQPVNTTDLPLALQYENGNLALRVYDNMNIYEGQKWLVSQQVMSTAIRTKDYMTASLFTPEFDPYSSTSAGTTLNTQNDKQVDEVINVVKSGIQAYLKQMGTAQPTGPSASSLGQKAMPISINLNLSESPKAGVSKFSNISHFANLDGSVSETDVLSLLDKYNSNQNSTSDLLMQMGTNQGCKTFNIGDYTSNRVSSCNCKVDLNY